MDKKDYQIIQELQKNGRLSNQELAERVNLSPSPCLRRLRNLEKSGVISGYTAIVNQKLYGLPITIFVQIKLDMHNKETSLTFEKSVQEIDEIIDCYMMTGACDYLLRVLIKDLDHYEKFVRNRLHNIPGVASMETAFAYGTVKQKHDFPNV